jgi:nucleolar protein 15
MQKYFSQFGDVTRVRVSRNKKTGASKHYAFVEFANAEVADIVAKTMDKYLMFGRILQCKVIPKAQVHAKLFEGANRRFKIVPRNKLAGAQMKHGAERPVWEKRIANEAKRREVTSKKLKESLSYEFELPQLKSVEDVPKKALALGDAPDKQSLPESLAVEVGSEVQIDQTQPGHMELTQTSKTKKSKKGKKTEAEPIETQPEPLEVAVAVDDAKIVVEKPKKGKKAAPVSEAEPVTSQVDEAEPIVEKKVKKSKKKSDTAPEPELAAVSVDNAEPVVEKKAKKSKKSKLETSVPEATVQAELEEEYADKPKKRKSLDGALDGKVKKSKKAKA